MQRIIFLLGIVLSTFSYGQDSISQLPAIQDFKVLVNIPSKKFLLSNEAINKWRTANPSLDGIVISEVLHYKSGLVIPENGTGRLFYIDSTGVAIRMDETQYGGDRYGAFNFVYNDTIFSIGGYGFWHINGAVRFFNTKTKEWNIIRTSQSVNVASGINAHFIYDEKEKKIYVLYKKYGDEYLKTKKDHQLDGKIFVQQFDLIHKDWSPNIYTLNEKIASHFNDISVLTMDSRSLFINTKNALKTLQLDISKNEMYEADDQLTAEWIELNRKNPTRLNYTTDSSIVIYDLTTNTSNIIRTTSANRKKISHLYQLPSSLKKISIEWILIIVLSALNIFSWIVLLKKYKQKPKNQVINQLGTEEIDQLVTKVKSFTDLLDEVETKVVCYLSRNYKDGKLTSIDEINKILGIEKRSYKIKNNMRADALKLINKKFMNFSSTTDELIIRERSSFDKRYFEYTLNDRYANKIGNSISCT